MTAKGHVLLASAFGYIPLDSLSDLYSPLDLTLAFSFLIFGSLLPDIDEPKSYIGQRSFYISHFFKLMGLQHRTMTHWLITPVLIAIFAYLIDDRFFSLIFFSLAFGMLAHDIGDLLTKGGIKGFFFPFFKNTKIGLLPYAIRFQTFSTTEMFFNSLLIGVNLYLYSSLTVKVF